MNMSELIEAVAANLEAAGHPLESRAQATRVVKAVLDEIEGAVAKGDEVRIAGFGTFSQYTTKPRKGRNVLTGESLDIPAKRVPKFKAGAKFKAAVAE